MTNKGMKRIKVLYLIELFLPDYTLTPVTLASGVLPAFWSATDILIVYIELPPGDLPDMTCKWHAAVLHMGATGLLDYDSVEFTLY